MSVQVIRHRNIEKELENILKEATVEAGYFGGDSGDGQSIAEIAAKNEVTRPFMSRAQSKAEKEAPEFYEKEASKKDFNVKTFFNKLGLKMVELIKKEIDTATEWAKPNSDYTIKMKGSSHPLIDTGTMRNNTDYRVK